MINTNVRRDYNDINQKKSDDLIKEEFKSQQIKNDIQMQLIRARENDWVENKVEKNNADILKRPPFGWSVRTMSFMLGFFIYGIYLIFS